MTEKNDPNVMFLSSAGEGNRLRTSPGEPCYPLLTSSSCHAGYGNELACEGIEKEPEPWDA